MSAMEAEDDPDDPGLEEIPERDLSDSESKTETDTATVKHRQSSDLFIAEGFYTDCDNLLKQYLSLKTSTFEDFVELWKKKKFSSIFTGRETYTEMLEFSEEALTIAKSFMLPPHSKVKRIGALYLMYGLYTQQPISGLVKYRFTPPEWSVLLKFVENLKANGFIDANYIFNKMCLDGAFLTVVHCREYALERNYRKYLMPWPARDKELDPSSTFSFETLMSRVYRGSLKAVADQCLNKYNSIKQLLEATNESKFQGVAGTDRELELVMQTDIEDVIGSADALKSTRKVTNIGQGRKALKDQAFQQSSFQKGSCIAKICSSQSSSMETVECQKDPEVLTASESDSEDTEFKLMVKPPSKKTRKMKTSKPLKQKKIQKEKSEEPGRRRSARRASFKELGSETVCSLTATSKKQSIVASKVSMIEEAISGSSHQTCPFIEIDTTSNIQSMDELCSDSTIDTSNDLSINVQKKPSMNRSPQNARPIRKKSLPTATQAVPPLAAEASSGASNISNLSPKNSVKLDRAQENRMSNQKRLGRVTK